MTVLALYRNDAGDPPAGIGAGQPPRPGQAHAAPSPELVTDDWTRIHRVLEERGIRIERWPASPDSESPCGDGPSTDQGVILARYAEEIARVQAGGGYSTVDAIRMTPDHPDREALRQKFLAEHTHSEDEVRFFVEGRGLFCLHLGDEVLQLICEADDWIAVPAGTPHWFDMGPAPSFCALRFFSNSDGWVAQYTGSTIARRFPLLEDLLERLPAAAAS